ncbi:MAG TPA: ATP-binding cassette domain-containing protein [Nitrospinota bacterium]|nr:ATP-binding cassette domain-containing protein [Nitrospinota bacterium]
MIEVENLTKFYGAKPAIQDISFKVEKGEILGLLGPNAAGKTTTMRILTCFFPATSGSAKVAGFDVFKESINVRKRIGYLPENVPLYTDMSVSSYLNFVAQVKGVPLRNRKKSISRVIDHCGIGEFSRVIIGKLSKGYRQRVGLAQALLNDPEVLILDEPTIGLDPRQIIEIRNLIKNMAGEKTIILSTHILPEVSMTCQRVIIINQGKVVTIDTPENLNKKLRKSMELELSIEGQPDNIIKCLKDVKGVLSVTKKEDPHENVSSYLIESDKNLDIRKDLSKIIVQNNFGLLEMKSIDMSLEDIFIKLVTEEKGEY